MTAAAAAEPSRAVELAPRLRSGVAGVGAIRLTAVAAAAVVSPS
jgi:hypothetical protein